MNTSSNENDDLQRRVEAELLPGEELLWVGQGDGRFNVRSMSGAPIRALLVLLVAGLVMASMFGGLFMSRGMIPIGFNSFFPAASIFGIMAIVLLLVVLRVSGVFTQTFRNAQATYAITNRRIMILTGRRTIQVASYGPQDIERIERRMRSDGSGDLIFRYEDLPRRYDSSYGGRRLSYDRLPVGFFGIADVRRVEALLIDTFRPEPGRDTRDENIEARTLDSLLGTDRIKRKRTSLAEGDPLQDDDLVDLAELTQSAEDEAATQDD